MNNSDLRNLYPFSPRNLDKNQLNKQEEDENLKRQLNRKLTLKDYSVVLGILVGTLIIMISIVTLNSKNDLRSRASQNNTIFYLYPKKINAKEGQLFTITPKLSSLGNNNVAEVTASFAFNPNELDFYNFSLKAINNPQLNYSSGSIDIANSEGIIKIRLEAKDKTKGVKGVINLPQMEFTKVSLKDSSVSLIPSQSSVIFTNGSNAEVSIDSPVTISSN